MSGTATARESLEIRARSIDTLQMNVTRTCNQSCAHCHVSASPLRREMMRDDVVDACIDVVSRTPGIATVDLTGGAPELHPRFADIVRRIRALNRRVIVRHNLTVAADPHPLTGAPMDWLPGFFASERVELYCSLPCYIAENTDAQRGERVFDRSIAALRRLNAAGFGCAGSGLLLDLVHNPVDAGLPGPQRALEDDYREQLGRQGVSFNRLLTITNVPLGRFASSLESHGRTEEYGWRIRSRCDQALAQSAMCRSLLSVGIDGDLFDCDFHQMAGLPVDSSSRTVFAFDPETLARRSIRMAEHCLVCLCGEGSTCGGALRPSL